jgi:enoyl-CoA hydratase/carnithine racemase
VTDEADVRIERAEEVAHLVLRNPGRRNAISAAMWGSLRVFADDARRDTDLRSVIISGDAGIFSAGADISGFEAGRSGASARDYDDLVETTLRAIEAMPQTVIAAIEGPCIGAGASLACACDFRIAAPESFFAVPAARLGLGYDPRGIARFVRIFGEPAAKEALLLADRIPAIRAHALGAVHRLSKAGQTLNEAREMAAQAAALAPLTQRAAKAALSELGRASEPSDHILHLAAVADASLDYAEGRVAFAEKRPPNFGGR